MTFSLSIDRCNVVNVFEPEKLQKIYKTLNNIES